MPDSDKCELSLDELKDVSGGLKGDKIVSWVAPPKPKGDDVGLTNLKGDRVLPN